MICSVLIPSRGRPLRLIETVKSFQHCASDQNEFEILIKLDDDDQPSLDLIPLLNQLHAKVVVTPRGAGYRDLHLFYSILAVLSQGDWLWMFNDDAIMTTRDWDQVLKAQAPTLMVAPWVDPPPEYDDGWKQHFANHGWHYDFPIISRKLFESVGQFSHSAANDGYWHDIACSSPLMRREVRELAVTHFYDRDETHPCGASDVFGVMKTHASADVQRHIQRALSRIRLDQL